MSAEHPVIIVGAGVSGLTLAYALSREGRRVLVLEKNPAAGGLARSYRYGAYVFDIGPHRFHTEDPVVTKFIADILSDDCLSITRSSAVFMAGRLIEWPLRCAALASVGPRLLLRVLGDMARTTGRKDGAGFDDYIISRYGHTLYEIFFRPYTEKFLGIPCSELAREWAVESIDRATIDKNAGTESLRALARSLLRRREPLRFLYPASGGISVFAEKLVSGIREHGGLIQLNAEVTGLETMDGMVMSVATAQERYRCADVVWTGSLRALAGCLNRTPPRLENLSLILYNYFLKTACQSRYQWCYFGEEHIPFNRVSYPTAFNKKLAPEGCSGICVEVTCREGDAVWRECRSREPVVRRALLDNGVISSAESVNGVAVEQVVDAYPVYRKGFRQEADRFIGGVKLKNLITAGRNGGFWYNNMDNSISEALDIAAAMTGGGEQWIAGKK